MLPVKAYLKNYVLEGYLYVLLSPARKARPDWALQSLVYQKPKQQGSLNNLPKKPLYSGGHGRPGLSIRV